ncbi:hypothetical protein JTB14_012036 [Gonioctena quinquepunctata]|nr:hypothetical protein JTB14_012036 [Gonioctena quinquepunctata]
MYVQYNTYEYLHILVIDFQQAYESVNREKNTQVYERPGNSHKADKAGQNEAQKAQWVFNQGEHGGVRPCMMHKRVFLQFGFIIHHKNTSVNPCCEVCIVFLKMVSQLFNFIFLAVVAASVTSILAAPQFVPQRAVYQNELPTPYEYQYKVENPPTNTFYGKNEAGDAAGRVAGSYYIYLPDGRLMTVDYFVDGDSGFVPKITFSKQSPYQGK